MTVVCGGTELLFMSLINTSVTFYKCCKISSNLWSFSFEMKTFFPNFNSCFFLSSSLWFCFLLQWRRRVQRWTLCVRTVSVSPRGGTVTVNLTVKTALMRVRKSAVSTHTHAHCRHLLWLFFTSILIFSVFKEIVPELQQCQMFSTPPGSIRGFLFLN